MMLTEQAESPINGLRCHTLPDKLIEIYGPEKGAKIKYCEAFEDSGYGAKLTKENLLYYFPFLKKQ